MTVIKSESFKSTVLCSVMNTVMFCPLMCNGVATWALGRVVIVLCGWVEF